MTSSIPIPQGDENNAVLTPRYSRLGWDTSTNLDWTDYDVNTRIEVDFFNGNTSGVFGSYDWRMRFAWVEFGPLLVGQAASVFMDYDVFPNVLDYQGPPGMILMRQGLARFKFPIHGDCTTVAMGVEQPYSDIQWEENGQFIVNPGTGIITDPVRTGTSNKCPTLLETSDTITGMVMCRQPVLFDSSVSVRLPTETNSTKPATVETSQELGILRLGAPDVTRSVQSRPTPCDKEPISWRICGWPRHQSLLPGSQRVGL